MEKAIIKDFDSYEVTNDGVVTNLRTGRVLKYDESSYGYRRVTLSQDSKLKRFFVHRLVAEYFLEPIQGKAMVNHIDGIKTNNHISNLEWVTCQENTQHAFRTGLRSQGENGAHAKLSNDLVKALCEEIARGLTRGEILSQERFKEVNKTQFDDIRRRRSWKSISNNFNW